MPNLRSVIQEAPMSITPAATPVNSPTSKTHSHPDQASWAPFIRPQIESCFFFTMYRCRIRSRAMSRCQSIVWKSSYCPIPGISSESTETNETIYKIITGGYRRRYFVRLCRAVDRISWISAHFNVFACNFTAVRITLFEYYYRSYVTTQNLSISTWLYYMYYLFETTFVNA